METNEKVQHCVPLELDDFQRSMMGGAVGGLVLFMLVWQGLALMMLAETYQLFSQGKRLSAEVYEHEKPYISEHISTTAIYKARVINASGKVFSFDIPKDIAHIEGTKFEVLGHNGAYKPPAHVKQELGIGVGMVLFGLLPFFVAYSGIKKAKQENVRIAQLKKRNYRAPALTARVVQGTERRAKSTKTVFRVHVQFEHQDKRYEAISKAYLANPSAHLVQSEIQVLVDRTHPLQSIVADDTLPKNIV
jgi:hypothetical protein